MTVDMIKKLDGAKQDYRAGKTSRFRSRMTGVAADGSGADYHIRNEHEWLRMIEQARAYDRDDIFVGAALNKLVSQVLQEGFNVDPQTSDEGLNAELKGRWDQWAEDEQLCHSEGEHGFRELSRLGFRSMLVDGDVFFLGLRDGTIQGIEAHRVRTPRNTSRDVVHGIHLDKKARRREVWIAKEQLQLHRGLQKVSDVTKYSVLDRDGHKQVFHGYLPDRMSQRRGVTAFAPMMDFVGMHDDLQFATLVKQQMGALIALIRESPEAQLLAESTPFGDTETESNQSVGPLTGVASGMEVTGDPGEKMSMFSPNIPGASFFEHSAFILTLLSVNLDLPLQVVLLDPTKTNFSGWRGAIDQARIRMRWMQQSWIKRFHKPIYEFKLRQWAVSDPSIGQAFAREETPLKHRWNAPGWAYIEPEKDAKADAFQAGRYLNSQRRIQAARGRDWQEIYREAIDDVAEAIEYAHAKAESMGIDDVTWQTLYLPPGIAENVQYNNPQQAKAEAEAEEGSANERPASKA